MIPCDTWDVLKPYEQSHEFQTFLQKIEQLYETISCTPQKENIFKALETTPYEQVKVVILGQDPYPKANAATGLVFSVSDQCPIQPSLRNIFQELRNEFGYPIPNTTDLTPWAKQGVLLLNTVLTNETGKIGAHRNLGWEAYTDHIIQLVSQKDTPVVFLLWGNDARKKKNLITPKENHLILETTHPSPLSANRGFLGCGHFQTCNDFLTQHGTTPIHWQL